MYNYEYWKIAKSAFDRGANVSQTLANEGAPTSTRIQLAYELQSGSYTKNFNASDLSRNKEIHKVVSKACTEEKIKSVGVFGVGEAKNWIGYEGTRIDQFAGIEISFGRLRYARENLLKVKNIKNTMLIKADATEKVFAKNSFDLCLTLHSIEPNGNVNGEKMLENVIDAASKFIILFEPDFSTAHETMRSRMNAHDYVRNISNILSSRDDIQLIEKFKLNHQDNPDNLTTCWILKKPRFAKTTFSLTCPFSGSRLQRRDDIYLCEDSGLAYPVIDEFPCINKEDGIFVGTYQDFG